MRALCTVRGPLAAAAAGAEGAAGGRGSPAAGGRGSLAAGARFVALRAPGAAQPLHFVLEAKARARDLKALAEEHFQLSATTDAQLFGLALLSDGEYLFVDLDCKLSKYGPKSWRSSHTHGLDANGRPLLELHLAVQFYVESPLLLASEPARRLYCHQLRANVRARHPPPPADLDLDLHLDLHRLVRELALLPEPADSHRYRMRRAKSEPAPAARLLVTARGLSVLPDDGPAAAFRWSAIGKLSFDRRKFEIRTRDAKLTLYSTSDDKSKYLFALCRETHQFSMKIAPRLAEVLRREEKARERCSGYSSSCDLRADGGSEQRVSVVSSASSDTTSGIVSDRVHSEDELEIMIDCPPAPLAPETLASSLAERPPPVPVTAAAAELKCAGSQCSSSGSTVVGTRGGGLPARRASDASSLELGFSHTAQNSTVSEGGAAGRLDGDAASTLYEGIGAATVAASSETSGVYTMGSSDITAPTSKVDTVSDASRTECGSSHYGSYRMNDHLARFDSVSSIVEESSAAAAESLAYRPEGDDCVDGGGGGGGDETFRRRVGSDASAASFHGDGSDPADGKHAPLSASELSDLIVGRGVYPKRQSVSDTLDSVSDYVRLPPPLAGESYLPGHEDTAPSDDHYGFFERPPTPPARLDSRPLEPAPAKPPPPYEFEHNTFSAARAPRPERPRYENAQVAARVVTSRPMITILKAEAGDVSSVAIERTFAGPMSVEHRFHESRRAGGSRPAPAPARDPSALVAMLKLSPPPPPPPPRPAPPPPPHLQQFHRQLYSDVDYVFYPWQDPLVSQQNYLESKLAKRHSGGGLRYRSAPFLASPAGSGHNLSDSHVQLPPPAARRQRERERPPRPAPRARSQHDLLESPPRARRPPPPPPPPPPYAHKKLAPEEARRDCAIDIKTLREKSKNLDLPLIAALCNDRSLLKQTKAFGAPEPCRRDAPTDTLNFRCKRDSIDKTSQITQGKKLLVRNPNDKLPDIPGAEPRIPRAMCNTYVAPPGNKLPRA